MCSLLCCGKSVDNSTVGTSRKPVMDMLESSKLLKKTGEEITANEGLASKKIIGYYFSAHWCPPCRMFTPLLLDFYNELVEDGAEFEIIFVSSDQSEDSMKEYINESHGNWLALPFNSEVGKELKSKYSVQGIPTLVIVKNDGTLVSLNGREDVQKEGPPVFAKWNK